MYSATEVMIYPSLNETVLLDHQAVPFASIEHPSEQTVIVRPRFTSPPSMLKKEVEAIDLGVEVVQVVERNRLKGFWTSGCAPLIPSMV